MFGSGTIDRLGPLARELGFSRPLLVTDRGLRDAGHVDSALGRLRDAGVEAAVFDACEVNPDAAMVDRGVEFAAACRPDGVIGLGGGSPLDCAKGVNLILTNGGTIADYKGYGLARKPLLPMIAVPTTAGTGSEAQSYAVIADTATHMKMACGDPKLAFAVAILDPDLTVSQPRAVTAAAGFDALAHAVETAVTTRRTPVSTLFSHAAFRLLNPHYERDPHRPGRPRRARRDAARGVLRGCRHRALDARGRARLRQPPDSALRPHPRARPGRPAAARRALERGGERGPLRRPRGRAAAGIRRRVGGRPPVPPARRRRPVGRVPARPPGPPACRPTTCRPSPRPQPRSGQARSTRDRSASARPSSCTNAPTDVHDRSHHGRCR